ncbi:hypothetical protein THAOC_18890, partial [Thalassiosira oceanica]
GDAEGGEVATQHRSRRLPTGVSRLGDPEGGGRQSLGEGQPILWRIQFPEDIVNALVSDSNPKGVINNSELELAGIVATNDVLAREVDVREATTATGTDNLPALSWSTKGAVSAKGPAAYLLRHQAMHQRVFRYQSPQAVADLPPGARDRLGPVLGSAMQAAASAGNPKRGRQRANAYARWAAYCAAFNVDPLLQGVPRPIPFMQTYLQQYRTGVVAARGQPVGARAAEEALRFVGQTMQQLGVGDKRFDPSTHKIDLRLSNMWRQWKSDDDPPARVKPIPMMVLMKAQELATADNSTASTCTARMMWINMFFLCRPGESCATRYAAKFFRLRDVTLLYNSTVLDLSATPDGELRRATDAHLNFSDQKNKHRNEKIGQKRTSHKTASPTVAIAEQVIHLRNNKAPPSTPLCAFNERGQWFVVTSEMLTSLLRRAVRACPECGLVESDISARSLRATGAMAMLCGGVDPCRIKLFGRWRSDELLTYLHVQAEPLYRDISETMLRGGDYQFVPGAAAYHTYHDNPSHLYN